MANDHFTYVRTTDLQKGDTVLIHVSGRYDSQYHKGTVTKKNKRYFTVSFGEGQEQQFSTEWGQERREAGTSRYWASKNHYVYADTPENWDHANSLLDEAANRELNKQLRAQAVAAIEKLTAKVRRMDSISNNEELLALIEHINLLAD